MEIRSELNFLQDEQKMVHSSEWKDNSIVSSAFDEQFKQLVKDTMNQSWASSCAETIMSSSSSSVEGVEGQCMEERVSHQDEQKSFWTIEEEWNSEHCDQELSQNGSDSYSEQRSCPIQIHTSTISRSKTFAPRQAMAGTLYDLLLQEDDQLECMDNKRRPESSCPEIFDMEM